MTIVINYFLNRFLHATHATKLYVITIQLKNLINCNLYIVIMYIVQLYMFDIKLNFKLIEVFLYYSQMMTQVTNFFNRNIQNFSLKISIN